MKVTLSRVMCVALVGDSPPTEFRIFARGVNPTSKGDFVFDDKAAASVMAAYREHGEEIMIDLEHLSLESTERSVNFDPDARGWFRLELRNGELWAVGVRWTPDGDARLRDKRQRFISPVFDHDSENRILALFNIALTAMPATHQLTPLVAANNRTIKMADTTGDGSAGTAGPAAAGPSVDLNALAKVLDVTEDPATDPGAFIAALKLKLEAALNQLGGDNDPDDTGTPPNGVMAEAMTTRREVIRLTSARTALEAIDRVSSWRVLALEHAASQKKLAEDRQRLEASERLGLYRQLVKLGSETPHTSGLAYDKPAKHLEAMSVEELRDRVQSLSARSGSGNRTADKPSAADPGGQEFKFQTKSGPKTVTLDARELAIAAEMKCPAEKAALRKLQRLEREATNV